MKVFWDTNLFIYLIEHHPIFLPKVLDLYRGHQERGETVITSTLTLGELLSRPIRLGRTDLVTAYGNLLIRGNIELVDFGVAAAEHYATIRAKTELRQPDALQLACAAARGASSFVTNDQRLWRTVVPGVPLVRGID